MLCSKSLYTAQDVSAFSADGITEASLSGTDSVKVIEITQIWAGLAPRHTLT